MTFVQKGAITYITNHPEWFVVDKSMFPTPNWPECWEITSFTNGTGGLEVYFVDKIIGARGLYEGSGRGIIVDGTNGSLNVMAHEIGHACTYMYTYSKLLFEAKHDNVRRCLTCLHA